MRKTKIAALIAAAALALGACGAPTTDEGPREGSDRTPQTVMVFDVKTSAATIECIFAKTGYGGGLSCNW